MRRPGLSVYCWGSGGLPVSVLATFRRIACSIYLAEAAIKILLLNGPGVPMAALIWITDLTPALCSIYILTVVIVRTNVND